VAFFISVVLGNVVQVVPSDHDGPLHLSRNDDSLQDFASDSHTAGEGAFLVDVGTLDGLLGGLEVQTDVFEVSNSCGCLLGQ